MACIGYTTGAGGKEASAMFALLQASTGATLGYLCVTAGFLVILASVVFVIKGKAVLSDSGTPNTVEWGKIKANLTSAVALFVLGAAMIALPFWSFQKEEYQRQTATDSQPAAAMITGDISGPGGKDVRLFLVVKPDYDQTYSGNIVWEFPLVAGRQSYSVIYTQDGTIIGEQPFSVDSSTPGSPPQKVTLPPLDLQTGGPAPQAISAEQITPQLDISNDEVTKSLTIH
jgi:hypothetical protein